MLSFHHFHRRIEGSNLVVYVDNEVCRMALIRGSSAKLLACLFLEKVVSYESSLAARPWYSRVPSLSNCSDDPSRLKCDELEKSGAIRTSVDWDFVRELMRKKRPCFLELGLTWHFVSGGGFGNVTINPHLLRRKLVRRFRFSHYRTNHRLYIGVLVPKVLTTSAVSLKQ